MKKNTKKLFFATLAVALASSVTASVVAFAANKESVIVDKVTNGTDIAIDYVKLEGENKDCYQAYETAGELTLSSVGLTSQGGSAVGSTVPASKIGENDFVEVTFDVLELTTNVWGWFDGFNTSLFNKTDDAGNVFSAYLYANGMAGLVSAGPNAGAVICKTDGTAAGAWIAHGFTNAYLNNHIGAHHHLSMKFEYYQDGTIKIYYGSIDRDTDDKPGTEFKFSMMVTGAYEFNRTAEEYAFSFGIGNSTADVAKLDNWQVRVVNSEDATDAEVITFCDFSDLNKIVADPTASDEVAAQNYYKVTYLNVTNPAADNRIESLSKIKYDENASVCFEMDATLNLAVLPAGKKVGFAFGLESRETALEDATFIYFYNENDITYINSSVAGVEGTPVSLEANLVNTNEEFTAVRMVCDNAKQIVVTVAGKEYTLTANSVEGYMAITQTGDGDCQFAIGTELSLINYTYRAGDGETIGHPFNVDYLDEELYTVQSTTAPHYTNVDEARGIVIEDEKLKFAGTSINAHFATAKTYADFILELDYTTLAFADRPALDETGVTFGYSALGIAFGKPEALSPWTSGKLIMLRDIYSKDDSFAPSYVQFYKENGAMNVHTVQLASRGEATAETEGAIVDSTGSAFTVVPVEGMPRLYNATTRLKLVVINNYATLYGVNLDADGNPVGDYVVIIEGAVKDSYGYISLSTDANAYFDIDNFKVTNLDAETLAGKTAEEILAGYEDHKAVADVVAPRNLTAPVITLNENVVSWDAVEGAAKYIVSVNGTTLLPQTETSYTITDTEVGDYEITVVAISDGNKLLLDSRASNAVTYTVEAPNDEPSKGGCGAGVGFGGLLGLLTLVGATAIFKKKD